MGKEGSCRFQESFFCGAIEKFYPEWNIREMDRGELVKLAASIRHRIGIITRKNGGHLASNLGIVELTISIHRNFSIPPDIFLLDTSHQCYAHKLLAGRGGIHFEHLRQDGGISGFFNREESDPFTLGHAGTALSMALGLAAARDARDGGEHIIALIGDGSLTCGLTMEALQHVAEGTHRLIIVLNDNGRAIDPIPGALVKRFSSSLFRDGYALDYVGPVNGHDFSELDDVLRGAKLAERPIVVHVKTDKGRGDSAAMGEPSRFHGIRPAGESASNCHSFAEIMGEALCSFARVDGSIVAITAAMAGGTGLKPFAEQFSSRFFDVGIAEGHALTFAAGLARGGLRPVCAIYSSFLQRAVDNVFHDICLQDLPVVICSDRAGLACGDGDTHHGLYDIAMFASLPNLIIAQPATPRELRDLLWTALHTSHPFLIRYGKESFPFAEEFPVQQLPIGRAEKLLAGKRVSIWAIGHRRLQVAMDVAKLLEGEKISTEVVNGRFIRPLDEKMLRRSANSSLLVTMEDHTAIGGFGSLAASALATWGTSCRHLPVAWPFPVGFAESCDILERRCRQTVRNIFLRILNALQLPCD